MDERRRGYPAQTHKQPVKRYCQTLDLKDDPQLIARYKDCHSPQGIWPEIPEGIRQAGILEMEIYLLDTRLFMIVETPLDFDWDTAFAHLATLPRQEEWEAFTALFQQTAAGASSSQKWQLMERIFHLYNR
ncbi:L-rhamnose mutarotase [Bacteroides sp. OttesenSCG-928-J23]|nr:L-rhamnose mutarotase [Bacteroides sp. OttesenSCG-928-N06]MDL2247597.1 L-rhamnose mutarotase [Bacteroides sp. OttesenSCG-928-J23]MDL2305920.1 L-rhamnose mutarotase [Bacteroides sp. OttesenSCG-928-D19]